MTRRRLTHDRYRHHRRGAGRIQRRHHRQKARSIRRRHRPEYRLARPRGARRQLSRPARYLRARPAERHGESGAGAGRGAAPRRRPSGDRHGRFVRALAGRGFHRGAARHPLHRRQAAQAAPRRKRAARARRQLLRHLRRHALPGQARRRDRAGAGSRERGQFPRRALPRGRLFRQAGGRARPPHRRQRPKAGGDFGRGFRFRPSRRGRRPAV